MKVVSLLGSVSQDERHVVTRKCDLLLAISLNNRKAKAEFH